MARFGAPFHFLRVFSKPKSQPLLRCNGRLAKELSLREGFTPLSDTTKDPRPDTKTGTSSQPSNGHAPGPKRRFIVIEVPTDATDHSYPKAIFACDTMEEAVKLCKQMNADAGHERYGIQRPANGQK